MSGTDAFPSSGVTTPDGITAGDASRVYVLPTPETPVDLDPTLRLVCDARRGSAW